MHTYTSKKIINFKWALSVKTQKNKENRILEPFLFSFIEMQNSRILKMMKTRQMALMTAKHRCVEFGAKYP